MTTLDSPPTEKDGRLRTLLQTWKVKETTHGFERLVWTRIRAQLDTPEVGRAAPANSLVWMSVTAASIALAMGVLAGTALQFLNGPAEPPAVDPRTLTGSYVALTFGETR